MLYSHFFIHHIKAHHKNVATPKDAVTARYGESVYTFWLRAIPHSYVEVWEYERNRLEREGKSKFSLENRVISFNLGHIVYLVVIFYFFGKTGLIFHLIYSMICIL